MECHENIKQTIGVLKLESEELIYALNMKLTNIYFGIESVSSYLCPWCEVLKKSVQVMDA